MHVEFEWECRKGTGKGKPRLRLEDNIKMDLMQI
jgi:hypothetical protein